MRIAYFSPLPPANTGVADYSATLLPELARHADITVFSDNDPVLSANHKTRPISEFAPRVNEFDARIYQLGNSPHYTTIYETLLKFAGTVVLHDGTLHHFFMDRLLYHHDRVGYLREMTYSHGVYGYEMAQAVLRGAFVYPYYEFPLVRRAIDHAETVIAHSDAIRRIVLDVRPDTRVVRIDHFAFTPPTLRATRNALRAKLGLPREAFVVASFGSLAHAKRAAVVLRAFAEFVRAQPRAFFVWVGATRIEKDVRAVVDELRLASRVKFVGYVDEATLYDYLYASDTAINLRYPTVGEASGAVMRLLAVGVPTIVTRAGWYGELPEGVVLHSPVGEDEISSLVQSLTRLAEDSSFRHRLSESARAFAETHSVARAAEAYLASFK